MINLKFSYSLYNVCYRFEEPDDNALNHTLDNDLSSLVTPDRQLSIPMDAESGRITFGDEDNMNTSLDFEEVETSVTRESR